MANYPTSVCVLDLDGVGVPAAIHEAVARFAKSRPYTGSLAERQDKFRVVIAEVCAASGIRQPSVTFKTDERLSSGLSFYRPNPHAITLVGRLSVITCLHEVAHAIHGSDEHVACAWSLRLFRDCFPRSWAKLRFDGHVAVSTVRRRD